MKTSVTMSSALGMMLAGCGSAEKSVQQIARAQGSVAAPTSGTVPFDTRLPMGEFMAHVMQHAGNGVWKWQGLEIDKAGEHSLYPKNTQEWEDAESGALTLAEVTNLLLLPGRRVAEPEWDKSVADVRRIALNAAKAAEKQDKSAFLAAGSALDAACDACHVRYDPGFAR